MLLNSVWIDREELAGVGAPRPGSRGCASSARRGRHRGRDSPQTRRSGGCDLVSTFALRKAPSSAPVAAGSTAIRALPAKEPVLTLDGVPVFSLLVLRRRRLLDGGDDQALVRRLAVLRPGLVRIAPAADEGARPPPESRAAGATGPRSARGAACAPWSRNRLIGDPQLPLQETWPRRRACRDPSDRRRETAYTDRCTCDATRFRR